MGQTSCLPVQAASCRLNDGAGLPREPSGWKPDPHFQTASDASRLTLTFSGAREDVEAQLDSAVDLGFVMAGTLDYDTEYHAASLPKPQRAPVLPSRLVQTLESLAPESFVARAGNGVIHYRGGSDAPRAQLPNALLRGIKNTFDPKGILPDMPT